MHTFIPKSTPITFHHHGDYSGDVILTVPMALTRAGSRQEHVEVTIPMEALYAFVAEALRDQQINYLEQATPAQILGLTPATAAENCPECRGWRGAHAAGCSRRERGGKDDR